MKRREFLRRGLLLAGAVSVNASALANITKNSGDARLKIGVLSDIHIRHADQTGAFETALKYFRDKGVDGVIVAGDMADAGLKRQLNWVSETWYKVFPKDKAPDGRHVEKLFVYGNHDLEGQNYGNLPDLAKTEDELKKLRSEEAIVLDRAGNWKRCFHEKYQPIYIKDVKGYKFVGGHWNNSRSVAGLNEFFEAHRKELEGDKPFFYFQHAHPKNTCSGEWAWGADDGTSTKILSTFPNCVAFSGHSHTILQDERTIWQGAFVSVGTSSLSYTYAIGGRENTYVDGQERSYQMPQIGQWDGKQGMLMTVYKDCITLERREFVYGETLGDAWVIPLPAHNGPQTLSFQYRADRVKVPQFKAGDKATVTHAKGKDRDGVEQMQYTVHFPNVLRKTNGVRAYDFEVQLVVHDVDVDKIMLTKRVMSPHFYLGEGKDGGEVTCVFGEKEIMKKCPFRFDIRPCECFGKKGDAIQTDWQQALS